MSPHNVATNAVRPGVARASVPDAPAPGDVIVRREGGAPGAQYSLREHPADPQILCGSRQAALEIARSFARARGVALWDDEGYRVTRLSAPGQKSGVD